MNRNRFRLALQQLRSADWQQFEELASEFLIDDYPNLRTTASSSGDGGRDAKLFEPSAGEPVVIQYSIREDWSTKIRETVAAMQKKFPDADELVYVTNKVIGAVADDLVREMRRKHKIIVDVRDQNWFLERGNTTRARQVAAETLAVAVVDPFLAREGVIEHKAQALSSREARAACVYLALQWQDDTRDKGLTRVCFEALVRSVLRDTDPARRMHRAEIRRGVQALLPAHPRDLIDRHTDSALTKLTKRFVRHYRAEDEFCLTFEERSRINDRLAEVEILDEELAVAITSLVGAALEQVPDRRKYDAGELAANTRLVLDRILWERGEVFAGAVARGRAEMTFPELDQVVKAVARTMGNSATIDDTVVRVLTAAAESALSEPPPEIRGYLRRFADAYTLFAFLRETPDVQAAVVKMFSQGDIWVDTTVVLPLFAEELAEDPSGRVYTNLLSAARECGLNLYITRGVLEELDSHMRRCLAYARHTGAWEGRVPFLAAAFALTGRARGQLPTWLDRFRGRSRPADDISEYLSEAFGIVVVDLDEYASTAPVELRGAVQEVWHQAHERRRGRGLYVGDANTTARLVDHDVENYLGVVRRRRSEPASPFGYTTWWLTLDRTAYKVRAKIKDHLPAADVPSSPVLSPDFLINYLAVGPIRNRLARQSGDQLPLSIADLKPLDLMPPELLDAAEQVRDRMKDMPEHVVQREVRDTLDRGRRRVGPLADGGLEQTMDDLQGVVSTEAP